MLTFKNYHMFPINKDVVYVFEYPYIHYNFYHHIKLYEFMYHDI